MCFPNMCFAPWLGDEQIFLPFYVIEKRQERLGPKRGQKGPKGAGTTGVSRAIEYPLLHEMLQTVIET